MLGRYSTGRGEGASAWLTREVGRLLARQRCTLADLHAVAVSAGPGSFTGLRVSLATAKGLCLALGLRLLMVPTLEVLANSEEGDGEERLAFIPYIGGEYHLARYRYSSRHGGYSRRGAYRQGRMGEIIKLCRGGARPIGPAEGEDLADLRAAAPDCRAPAYPDAATLAHLARLCYARREWSRLEHAEPLYLRKSQAEERAKARRAKRCKR